ncbi:hypothetical protein PIB30_002343 [Stylosanthes scabra]|uniref:Transposase, Ptta/En/Spm, plant n=1 Tax=Stylosanthes scabra TaxID=79078 RepID=A0ABU6V4U9_9FABA|nr:hypothetical protein [Stylosanthes scabra]
MPRKSRFNLPTTNDAVADVQTGGNLVGTMDRRTKSSSVHRQKVSDIPLSSGSGTKQALPKVTQFRLPRNEVRPGKSARIVVLKVPAPRENSLHLADMDDSNSEDEDYISEANEEESSGNLSEREEDGGSGKETRRKDRDVWHVQVIENGVERPESITAKHVFSLSAGRKVVLKFDTMLKPVGDAGGLLSTVLGSMTGDFSLFPIRTRSWKHMTINKEREYNRQIMRFFSFEDDAKGFMKSHCCPVEIDQKDWKAFIEYRLERGTQEKCRKNAENRSKQLYTHIGGSKSMARRREEEVRRHGRHISRGEMWTMVHRRKDGSYIHDDARAIGKAIANIESRDESTKELSQNDSLAQVLGKEHSGRVRGIGPGPCLSKLVGSTSQQSDYGVQIAEYQKEIVALRAEAAEEKKKTLVMQAEAAEEKKKTLAMQNVMRFLVERLGGDLPPEIASQMTTLGSGPSTSQSRPSSDNPDIFSSP